MATALVPFLLLAGCSGSGPEGDGGPAGTPAPGPHGEHMAGAHLMAPGWQVGDYWTMQSPQGGEFTHAISGESGGDWIMDTDSADTAFFDAASDISFLGKVRKSDLAGSQGDTRVEFLKFPLEPGMSWSTTWDGAPTMIHVGEVADGKAELTAMRDDGTTYAKYTYDDEARYFSHFAFHSPDGLAVGFEWSLQKSGSGFGGQLVRWTLETVFETHGPFPGTSAQGFAVEPGITDVYIEVGLACTQGGFTLQVGEPSGYAEERGISVSGPCPATVNETAILAAPTETEQWGVAISPVPQVTEGTLDLRVLKRTQMQFAVGDAPG